MQLKAFRERPSILQFLIVIIFGVMPFDGDARFFRRYLRQRFEDLDNAFFC